MLSPIEMAQVADENAYKKVMKHWLKSFISAVIAGAFIAIAFAFYTTTQVGSEKMSWGSAKLIGGTVFSLGIIMCVIFGAELFTSSTMNIISKVNKRISWQQFGRNLAAVYAGNFVGALIIVMLIWFSNQIMAADGNWGLVILKTARHKIHHTWLETMCLGILCNIMVCIAVWMAYAGKSLTDKAFIMILPIAMFVSSGFEHCVANMFMIPMGIVIQTFASTEFWEILQIDPALFADLTNSNFIFKNLIPATTGNFIGGAIFVALPQWFLHLRS